MGLSAGGAICGGGLSVGEFLQKFLRKCSTFFMHFLLFFDEYCM